MASLLSIPFGVELSSYISYVDPDLFHWRSESKFEVDFVLQRQGEKHPFCAIEVKAKSLVHQRDYVGLKAFGEEFKNIRKIVVSLEPLARKDENEIEIWPGVEFFKALWRKEGLFSGNS